MSMNYNSNDTNKPTGALEPGESMFAGVPAWERSAKKKRGFGGSRKVAATAPVEPVTTAPLVHETRVIDPVSGRTVADRIDRTEYATMGAAAVADEPLMAPPPRTTTRTVKKSGVSPIAIAAGIVALGGLAAAGWYASQPQDHGVAQLAPGEPTSVTTTTTTAPSQMAANTAMPPAVTRTETTRTTSTAPAASSRTTVSRTTTVRTRPAPAASSSAMDMGVNTSATLPAGPQPYSGTAAPAAPAFNYTGPTAATPAPAAPAPVNPDPTPVEPSASSSASSPTPDTTATPPVASPPQ